MYPPPWRGWVDFYANMHDGLFFDNKSMNLPFILKNAFSSFFLAQHFCSKLNLKKKAIYNEHIVFSETKRRHLL